MLTVHVFEPSSFHIHIFQALTHTVAKLCMLLFHSCYFSFSYKRGLILLSSYIPWIDIMMWVFRNSLYDCTQCGRGEKNAIIWKEVYFGLAPYTHYIHSICSEWGCHSQWQGLHGHFMTCEIGNVTRMVCVFTAGSILGKEELSVSSRWEIEGSVGGMVS
jgi:hypothetical protein